MNKLLTEMQSVNKQVQDLYAVNAELFEALKSLIHQIEINDYVDSHGHEARMLQALYIAKKTISKFTSPESDIEQARRII